MIAESRTPMEYCDLKIWNKSKWLWNSSRTVTRIPFRKQMDLYSIVPYEFPKEEVLKRKSFFACISMKLPKKIV